MSFYLVVAAKCTPLQVINLLNDLFVMFDEIIETFDCYKVYLVLMQRKIGTNFRWNQLATELWLRNFNKLTHLKKEMP